MFTEANKADILRLVRHIMAPAVAFLVGRGYVPDSMSGDLTEGGIVAASLVVAFIWSRANEKGL